MTTIGCWANVTASSQGQDNRIYILGEVIEYQPNVYQPALGGTILR